jgi:hypothetical protein
MEPTKPFWPIITIFKRKDFELRKHPPTLSNQNRRAIEIVDPNRTIGDRFYGHSGYFHTEICTCPICLKKDVPTILLFNVRSANVNVCIECIQTMLKPIPNEKEMVRQNQHQHLQKQLIELDEKKQKQKKQCKQEKEAIKKERKETKLKIAALRAEESESASTATASATAAATATATATGAE